MKFLISAIQNAMHFRERKGGRKYGKSKGGKEAKMEGGREEGGREGGRQILITGNEALQLLDIP